MPSSIMQVKRFSMQSSLVWLKRDILHCVELQLLTIVGNREED